MPTCSLVARVSESSSHDPTLSPPPTRGRTTSGSTCGKRSSVSYKDDTDEESEDEVLPTSKKRSRSVRMRLVQRATNVARDVMKKKYQQTRMQSLRQHNPWADDYEEMVYDLPHTDACLDAMDVVSQAGSHASSQDHVPPEVKKISVVRETGENVLHKAARLGYKVS